MWPTRLPSSLVLMESINHKPGFDKSLIKKYFLLKLSNFPKKLGYKHLLSPAVLRFSFDSYKDKQCECFEVLPHSDWFRGEQMIPGYIWIVLTELKKWYSYSADIFKPNIIHISIWMNFQIRIYSYFHNLSTKILFVFGWNLKIELHKFHPKWSFVL